MGNKQLYTTGEIAKLCGVHNLTALRWIHKGQLKAFQLPGRGDNRVKRGDLITFLKEYKMPVPHELNTNERILIVDDDIRMAHSIQRLLKREGADAMICTEGFKAGVMVTSLMPQLVILDLNMPGMGGMEILKYVRSLDILKNVKILIVSAMPQRELNAALKAGANDALNKPFDNNELIRRIMSLIEEKS